MADGTSSTAPAPAVSTPTVTGGADAGQADATKAPKAGGANGTPAEQPDKKAADTITEPRRFRVKVDQEERDVDEAELVRNYQLRTLSEKRLQEAAQKRKEVESLFEQLKTNPRSAMRQLAKQAGVDLRQVSEEELLEHLQLEQMTPEQRKIKEYEEKIAKFEADGKASEEQKKQAELDAETKHWAGHFEAEIMKGLDMSGVPKTEYTVKRMASLMGMSIQNKMDLPAEHIAALVREDLLGETQALLKGADAATIERFLGKDLADTLRKADIAKLKSGSQTNGSAPGATSNTEPAKREHLINGFKPRSREEYEKWIDGRIKTGA